jgi:hypothetical protein
MVVANPKQVKLITKGSRLISASNAAASGRTARRIIESNVPHGSAESKFKGRCCHPSLHGPPILALASLEYDDPIPKFSAEVCGSFFRKDCVKLYFGKQGFTMSFTEHTLSVETVIAPWLVSFRDQLQPGWPQAPLRSSIQQEVALTSISASRFASVLQVIGRPTGRRLEILRAHYTAPGHAATPTVLAKHVGFKGSIGISVSYGTLAKRIGLLVGQESPNISLLFEVVRPTTATSREWVLVMRPEFADGLKRAGWIDEQRLT